jgi:hypothetical protein
VLNRSSPAVGAYPVFRSLTLDNVARVVGLMLAAWLVYGSVNEGIAYAERRRAARATPLNGIWGSAARRVVWDGWPV